jgi:ribosome silencing factor RsfS/YbeB/iojap
MLSINTVTMARMKRPLFIPLDQMTDSLLDRVFKETTKKPQNKPIQLIRNDQIIIHNKPHVPVKTFAATEPKLRKKRSRNEHIANTSEKPNVMDLYDQNNLESSEGDSSWYEGKVINSDKFLKAEKNDIPRWMKASSLAESRRLTDESVDNTKDSMGIVTVPEIVLQLEKESGFNIVVLDLRLKCHHIDYMVLADGNSNIQVYNLIDSIRMYYFFKNRLAKNRYVSHHGLPEDLEVQGRDAEDWMCIDLGHVIVHCFTPEARNNYGISILTEIDLEGLWEKEGYDLKEFV